MGSNPIGSTERSPRRQVAGSSPARSTRLAVASRGKPVKLDLVIDSKGAYL